MRVVSAYCYSAPKSIKYYHPTMLIIANKIDEWRILPKKGANAKHRSLFDV
jgi:hypothetical protein